jgi:hypothetical protein
MKENLVKSALQLLEARKATLEQINRTSMKAHGKWMNKEFFSWENAHPISLGNTLIALPYPIIWIVQQEELEQVTKLNKQALENIHQLIVVNNSDHTTINCPTANQIGVKNFAEALLKINEISVERSVVLISIQGQEDNSNRQELLLFLTKLKGI